MLQMNASDECPFFISQDLLHIQEVLFDGQYLYRVLVPTKLDRGYILRRVLISLTRVKLPPRSQQIDNETSMENRVKRSTRIVLNQYLKYSATGFTTAHNCRMLKLDL